MKTFSLALMTAPFMVILDLLWTGFIAHAYYVSQFGSLLSTHIIIWPLLLFYIIYIAALAHFVVKPGVDAHKYSKVVKNGAFLGLTAYSTYDLVNLGITTGWPLAVSFVDIGWGIVISVLASSAGYWLATKVFNIK